MATKKRRHAAGYKMAHDRAQEVCADCDEQRAALARVEGGEEPPLFRDLAAKSGEPIHPDFLSALQAMHRWG